MADAIYIYIYDKTCKFTIKKKVNFSAKTPNKK